MNLFGAHGATLSFGLIWAIAGMTIASVLARPWNLPEAWSASAGAILLERATSRGPSAPAAQFWLEPEEGNDVLWREENNDAPKQRVSAKR